MNTQYPLISEGKSEIQNGILDAKSDSVYSKPSKTIEEIEAENKALEEAKKYANMNWNSLTSIDYQIEEENEVSQLIGAEIPSNRLNQDSQINNNVTKNSEIWSTQIELKSNSGASLQTAQKSIEPDLSSSRFMSRIPPSRVRTETKTGVGFHFNQQFGLKIGDTGRTNQRYFEN